MHMCFDNIDGVFIIDVEIFYLEERLNMVIFQLESLQNSDINMKIQKAVEI